MDYKKTGASQDCLTRNIRNLDESTGNIYETIAILTKRANQISNDLREEFQQKVAEYSLSGHHAENMEEVFENREQIEIAKYYETIPKPTLLATQELMDNKIYFREPGNELEL